MNFIKAIADARREQAALALKLAKMRDRAMRGELPTRDAVESAIDLVKAREVTR